MKLILLGPAGSGKGTLASSLSKEYSIPSISTGDLFRETVAGGSELGQKIRRIMERGDLVPDDITVGVLEERLKRGGTSEGFILDGFPRTLEQARALSAITGIDAVLNLVIEDDAIIRRLAGRRICGSCGAVYHTANMRPHSPGICDRCGGELITREDDQPASIRNRLDVYKEKTAPLISYYREAGSLSDIDAAGSPKQVLEIARIALRGG